MKICWDNLEKLRYNRKKDKWYDEKNNAYIYKNKCKTCNEPFLTRINTKGVYCSNKCKKGLFGKEHPMYGKKHTEKTKQKISKSNKGRKLTGKKLENVKNGNKNKNKGKSNPMYGKYNEKSANWKGSNGLPLYNTYAPQIEWCEPVRRNKKNPKILEVKCAYCGKWYVPSYISICNRLQILKNNKKYYGECKFYCSVGCKKLCPIFNQKKWPKRYKIATSREVQPELRQLVFKRDDYKCVKCGSEGPLHCHHIEGVRWEPIESADIDKCITLCKDCHIKIHKKEGCGYNDLQCNK